MESSKDFLSHFEADGRFREENGTLSVVVLTNRGGKYPGRLTFKSGLCVAADMEGISRWSFPDDSPLNGLRLLLHFDQEEPLVLLVDQGRILTPEMLQAEEGIIGDETRPRIIVTPRAHTTLFSLSRKERDAALATVTRLASTPPAEWPRDVAPQLGEDKPVYLLRITSDLRAFVRVNEAGALEVHDIVSAATIRTFLEQSKVGSGTA